MAGSAAPGQASGALTREDRRELERSGVGAGLAPGGDICVHPGARTRDKCWPARLFAAVADALAGEYGLAVVLTGSAAEAGLTAAVADQMRRARLLICNDTGVSHIAAGLRLKSVVVFSKADLKRWAPLDQRRHRCLWDPAGERPDAVLEQALPTKPHCCARIERCRRSTKSFSSNTSSSRNRQYGASAWDSRKARCSAMPRRGRWRQVRTSRPRAFR